MALFFMLVAGVLQMSLFANVVSGHGRLMEPPNRSSIWRFPEFSHLSPPQNFNDNELFCGNRSNLESNLGKCGICGDSYNDTVPRDNEDGGHYGRGIIVRGYRSGQIMPVEVELTTNHFGYFEMRLCSKDDISSHLDEGCYNHLLPLEDASGTKHYVASLEYGLPYYARYGVRLPKGVTCNHCVLQWHYQTGNRWSGCKEGDISEDCPMPEVFRGCSDIKIYPENEENIDLTPNSKHGVFPVVPIPTYLKELRDNALHR